MMAHSLEDDEVHTRNIRLASDTTLRREAEPDPIGVKSVGVSPGLPPLPILLSGGGSNGMPAASSSLNNGYCNSSEVTKAARGENARCLTQLSTASNSTTIATLLDRCTIHQTTNVDRCSRTSSICGGESNSGNIFSKNGLQRNNPLSESFHGDTVPSKSRDFYAFNTADNRTAQKPVRRSGSGPKACGNALHTKQLGAAGKQRDAESKKGDIRLKAGTENNLPVRKMQSRGIANRSLGDPQQSALRMEESRNSTSRKGSTPWIGRNGHRQGETISARSEGKRRSDINAKVSHGISYGLSSEVDECKFSSSRPAHEQHDVRAADGDKEGKHENQQHFASNEEASTTARSFFPSLKVSNSSWGGSLLGRLSGNSQKKNDKGAKDSKPSNSQQSKNGTNCSDGHSDKAAPVNLHEPSKHRNSGRMSSESSFSWRELNQASAAPLDTPHAVLTTQNTSAKEFVQGGTTQDGVINELGVSQALDKRTFIRDPSEKIEPPFFTSGRVEEKRYRVFSGNLNEASFQPFAAGCSPYFCKGTLCEYGKNCSLGQEASVTQCRKLLTDANTSLPTDVPFQSFRPRRNEPSSQPVCDSRQLNLGDGKLHTPGAGAYLGDSIANVSTDNPLAKPNCQEADTYRMSLSERFEPRSVPHHGINCKATRCTYSTRPEASNQNFQKGVIVVRPKPKGLQTEHHAPIGLAPPRNRPKTSREMPCTLHQPMITGETKILANNFAKEVMPQGGMPEAVDSREATEAKGRYFEQNTKSSLRASSLSALQKPLEEVAAKDSVKVAEPVKEVHNSIADCSYKSRFNADVPPPPKSNQHITNSMMEKTNEAKLIVQDAKDDIIPVRHAKAAPANRTSPISQIHEENIVRSSTQKTAELTVASRTEVTTPDLQFGGLQVKLFKKLSAKCHCQFDVWESEVISCVDYDFSYKGEKDKPAPILVNRPNSVDKEAAKHCLAEEETAVLVDRGHLVDLHFSTLRPGCRFALKILNMDACEPAKLKYKTHSILAEGRQLQELSSDLWDAKNNCYKYADTPPRVELNRASRPANELSLSGSSGFLSTVDEHKNCENASGLFNSSSQTQDSADGQQVVYGTELTPGVKGGDQRVAEEQPHLGGPANKAILRRGPTKFMPIPRYLWTADGRWRENGQRVLAVGMEMIQGRSLTHLLQQLRGPMKPSAAILVLEIALKLVESQRVLAESLSKPLINWDTKPGNIILELARSTSGRLQCRRAVIVDLGDALPGPTYSFPTRHRPGESPGYIICTKGYCSPECALLVFLLASSSRCGIFRKVWYSEKASLELLQEARKQRVNTHWRSWIRDGYLKRTHFTPTQTTTNTSQNPQGLHQQGTQQPASRGYWEVQFSEKSVVFSSGLVLAQLFGGPNLLQLVEKDEVRALDLLCEWNCKDSLNSYSGLPNLGPIDILPKQGIFSQEPWRSKLIFMLDGCLAFLPSQRWSFAQLETYLHDLFRDYINAYTLAKLNVAPSTGSTLVHQLGTSPRAAQLANPTTRNQAKLQRDD